MNADEQEELASLYVLGLLEGSELAAFERELSARPQLSALVTEMESASAFLAPGPQGLARLGAPAS